MSTFTLGWGSAAVGNTFFLGWLPEPDAKDGQATHDRFRDLGYEQAIREDEEILILIMGFLECH